jgi:hypothetical protein
MGDISYIKKDVLEKVIATLHQCRQELNSACLATAKKGIQGQIVPRGTTGMFMADECLDLLIPKDKNPMIGMGGYDPDLDIHLEEPR